MVDDSMDEWRRIKLLALDVDGVLTDGSLYMGEEGEAQKRFNATDGLGLKLLLEAGFKVALISGLASSAVVKRFEKLGVLDLFLGSNDKIGALEKLLAKYGLEESEIAYVGDDSVDLPVMRRIGLPIAVANAIDEVKRAAKYTTRLKGGEGAVREVIDRLLLAKGETGRSVAVIPARYGSVRFPGKALADIDGLPMVVRVADRVSQSSFDEVLIATDDERIFEACRSHGFQAVMTNADHVCGTDRVAEAVRDVDAEIVVNIQGDEPMVDPSMLDQLLQTIRRIPEADMATLAAPIEEENFEDRNIVKVVATHDGRALYFSRSPIPHGGKAKGLRHIGVYAFRRTALELFAITPPCELERMESLEQLRAIEAGMHIRIVMTDKAGPKVDRPEDLAGVVEALRVGKN